MRRDMRRNDAGPLSLLREAVRSLVPSELRLGLGFDLLCPSCGFLAGSRAGLARHHRAMRSVEETGAWRMTGGLAMFDLLPVLYGCTAAAWGLRPGWEQAAAQGAALGVQQAQREAARRARIEAARSLCFCSPNGAGGLNCYCNGQQEASRSRCFCSPNGAGGFNCGCEADE